MVVSAAKVVVTVVMFTAGVGVFDTVVVVTGGAVTVFGVLPPLVTGAAAISLIVLTDRVTDPCPTVVVPLVSALPSL